MSIKNVTVLPAQLPPNAVAPSAYASADIYENWKALKLADDLYHRNLDLANHYRSDFSDWFRNYDSARDRNTPPPKPPKGFTAILHIEEQADGGVGFLYDEFQNGDPVCPEIPYQRLPGDPAVVPPLPPPAPVYEKGATLRADSPSVDDMPVGFEATMDDGSKWLKKVRQLLMGRTYVWVKVAMLLLCLSLMLPVVHAQVNLKFTPEPMAVPTAQISNAHDLGRWVVEGCNDGVTPATIPSERISMAAGPIRLVDADDALLVLTSHTRRGFWGQVAHWGPIVGMGVAAGLGVGGITNAATTVAISGGAQLLPTLTQVAQGEVPSVTPLISQLKYPITLAPGACFTDHRFAAKVPKPEVVLGTIK